MFQVISITFILSSLLILPSQSENKFPIFYKFPGFELAFPIDLYSNGTVGNAIHEICKERQILLHERRYHYQMRFQGKILLNDQFLGDVEIGRDARVHIIIQLTSVQKILNAFANSNFKEILGLSADAEQNCSDLQPFIGCVEGIAKGIYFVNDLRFQGTVDFSLLPDTIQYISLYGVKLTGTIDFLHLPRDLLMMYVKYSQFTADFSCMSRDQWPKHLKSMHLENNKLFVGSLDCSELPRSLNNIGVSHINNDIKFHDLPPRLGSILVTDSILDRLDLSEPLPESLTHFSLINIEFQGEIKLQGIRNCSSLEFVCDLEMCSRLQKAAIISGVSVKFASYITI